MAQFSPMYFTVEHLNDVTGVKREIQANVFTFKH